MYGVVVVAEQLWKFTLDAQLVMDLVEMKAKWLSYYRDIPQVILVAFILDHGQKLEGLSVYLEA